MTQRGLRSTARSWFWFILVGPILGALIGFGLSVNSPPSYTARVTILVTPAPRATGITNGDLQVAQAFTPTLGELARTGPVLHRVTLATKVAIDTDALAKSVTTRVPVGTTLLTISVSHGDPADAAALANGIASELNAYASTGQSSARTGLQIQLTVVDPATPPIAPDGPGVLVLIGLGAAIALILSISIVSFVENVWPQGRDVVRAAVPGVAPSTPPSPGAPVAEAPSITDRNRFTERGSTTIGRDPLKSGSIAPEARIASRGVINELEVRKSRRSE